VLHKQGELIRQVYFPNGGVCSITTVLSDGMTVEAATVGDEGMLGIEAFLTDDAVAPGETVVQVPDTDAVMMGVETFRREIADHGALHELLGRYTQIVIAQMMQTTACGVWCATHASIAASMCEKASSSVAPRWSGSSA
jgi:CRP-like cAMP-binding protein